MSLWKGLTVPAIFAWCLFADPTFALASENVEQAKVYFETGAQAYEAGKYEIAIRAFEEAYRISTRPGIVFSIAQAYRKQFFDKKQPQDLKKAIEYYRKYLDLVKEGGRRNDATAALESLEPMQARMSQVEIAPSRSSEDTKPQSTLTVTASVKDSMVSIDGGAAVKMPFMAEIKPGKHTVKVMADGYYSEEREVPVAEGGIASIDVPLRAAPAKVTVKSRAGAQVAVDGRLYGTAPLSRPIEIDDGVRFISVTMNGYKAFAQEITLKRGDKKEIVANLQRTTQRTVSYLMLGASAVSAGFGVIFALGAASAQQDASDLNQKRLSGSITASELDSYTKSLKDRDQARVLTGVAFGTAAVFAGTGFLLYLFDQPVVNAPPPRTERKPAAPASSPVEPTLEISLVPAWAPGLAGASIQGRF